MNETQSKQGGARVRFPPPLVFLALIGVGVAIDLLLWSPAIPIPFWPRVIGGGTAAASGLALVLIAGGLFRRTGQDPAPWKPTPQLIVEGIYRRTRNPMYLGMTLFQLGLGFALGAIAVVMLAPLGLATVHLIAVRPEERYLEARFGEPYRRYMSEVRRYL
jgi:protein-S-isoprenylcysteine O-methyltransferase Ste14